MRLFAEDAGIVAEVRSFCASSAQLIGFKVLVLALGALALHLFDSWAVRLLLAFAMVVYGAIIGFMMWAGRWPITSARI